MYVLCICRENISCMYVGLSHSIIRWPGRIYHGLFSFDVMHCLYINMIGYLQDAFLDLLTLGQQKRLDSRVVTFTPFRNPQTGYTTKRVTSLSSIGYMSAEQRVVHLFVWSHAIGSRALIFDEAVRQDVLLSLTSLQVMCYSVRGNLPFTKTEHRYIFNHHGKRFFRCLGNLVSQKRRSSIQRAESYNIGKPPHKRRRVPYIKHVPKPDNESSDTAESSDASCAPPFFIRDQKIVPHSIVHFPDQVIMGGTHNFHNTAHVEACHIKNIQSAGQRARIYSDLNSSSNSMLNYQMSSELLEHIIDVTLGMS